MSAEDDRRLDGALDDRDRARAQLAAIRHALDGLCNVSPGDYAWSPELARVRALQLLAHTLGDKPETP